MGSPVSASTHSVRIGEAVCYAMELIDASRFEDAKALLRKTLPVAQRVFGDDIITLTLRGNYARALFRDAGATLDDLREAVETLEETALTARRVLGGAHPVTKATEGEVRKAQAALRARETPPTTA